MGPGTVLTPGAPEGPAGPAGPVGPVNSSAPISLTTLSTKSEYNKRRVANASTTKKLVAVVPEVIKGSRVIFGMFNIPLMGCCLRQLIQN